MVIATMHRILTHVLQRVMHPAHIPLHRKTQATQIDRARHLWPGGGLLRDYHGAWLFRMGHAI